MVRRIRLLSSALVLILVPVVSGQVTLNPIPARVLGHPQLTLRTASPNLVEGRELYGPAALAVDTSATPPILYVADTGNNRVLAWRNASQFENGAFADLVIGQKDKFSTFPQGPGGELTGGLFAPSGVAVDAGGNLFVADAGNNRILRYSKPFDDPSQVKLPDLVIGQASLGTRTANNDPDTRTISARTLALSSGSSVFFAPLLFDKNGNLYIADAGNKRVLRYKAADVGSSATSGPAADLILGQPTFTSAPQNPTSIRDLSRLAAPAGIAIDSAGILYVCDGFPRVLVYEPLRIQPGATANRMIGGVVSPQGFILQPPDPRSLNSPNGVFAIGDRPYVIDSGNNRILRFKPYKDWPADTDTPPSADDVIGQTAFTDYKANRDMPLPQFELPGSPGVPAVSFFSPSQAVLVGGELFVADSLNHRLVVSSDPSTTAGANMVTKRVLGQQFRDGGAANLVEGREFSFGGGGGVVVDTRSTPPRLYVADTANSRILGFRDARAARPGDKADLVIGQPEFIRSIPNWPSNSATQVSRKSLFNPTGLALDASGNLYVADTGNGRVLRFPRPFDGGNYPDADLVLGKATFTTPLDTAFDASPTYMNAPYGLAFTSAGHLLVSDAGFNRLLMFRKPQGGDFTNGMQASIVIGQSDFYSRTASSDSRRLRSPRHIGVDTSDRLFVCDTGNNRIQAYDSIGAAGQDPNPAFQLTNADPVGSLNAPQGVFVSPVTGEIWVANSNTQYILRYPNFETLLVNGYRPDFVINTGTSAERALALTVDGFGNLLAVLSTNRLGFYFAASTPVNAAHYLARLAPGMMTALYDMPYGAAVFGTQSAAASSLPLPKELADIQVLVNDQPVPLLFVSPDQINFIMPMSAPTSGTISLQVVRKSLNQVLAVGCSAVRVSVNPERFLCSGLLQMDVASPALFAGTGYSAGTGQIAAYNVRSSDGTGYGINSATNPVAHNDYIVMFGTGQGFIENAPPDGAAPGGAYPTPGAKPQVIVNVRPVTDDNVAYSGLSPEYPGLWQLNVKIPDTTPQSDRIQVVVVHRGIPSNEPTNPGRIVTTIAVKR
ncbi:MAG TPA: hypothetical protein VLH09_02355 [Bryobacteraceae bacterium]|nr:hypothetical protein [Bryobacteraceae bacterium]